MSAKIYLFYLQVISMFFYSKSLSLQKMEEEEIFLYKIEGNFIEFNKSQLITLFIKSYDKIDPEDITELELFKGGITYNPTIECFEASISSDINKINCHINFNKISFGKYKINSITYKNGKKPSDITFEVKEVSNKKISEMILTSFNGEIKEFQEYQKFSLIFDKKIQVPSRLQRMKIINDENKKYSIELRCNKDDYSIISLNCFGDFPLNIGKYRIIDILFYNEKNDFEFINTKDTIAFDVKEDILLLKRVYGEAYKEKFNLVGLKFQDIVYIKYFSKFFIRNIATKQDYDIDYKFENDLSHSSSDEKIIFDFKDIPIGRYYINFIYKRHEHINNIIINIKEPQKIDICYDDEGIDN